MGMYVCELCRERAALYCCADEAYLCNGCDGKVHSANFLVARHLRSMLCCRCQAPTLIAPSGGKCLSDPDSREFSSKSLCPTCARAPRLERLAESSSGDVDSEQSSTIEDDGNLEEVSSTMVNARKRRRRSRSPSPISVIPARAEGTAEERVELVLGRWSKELGLATPLDHIVYLTKQLLRRIVGSIKCNQIEKLDARSALAACLWMSLKLDSSSLPRVDMFEKCTGISADVLLCLEAKLCHVYCSTAR